MTSERLQEILDEISDNGTRIMRPHMVMKAMKYAVNEAIQECADSLTTIGSVDQNQDLFFKHHKDANNKRILKLKVK